MDTDDLASFQVQKVIQQVVVNLGRPDLQKRNRTEGRPGAEVSPVLKIEGTGCNIVFAGKPGLIEGVPVETELTRLLQVQAFMEHSQTLVAFHGCGLYRQCPEVIDDVAFNLGKTGTGLLDVLGFDGKGHADTAIIAAFGNLTHQHIAVFLSDHIELVALCRNSQNLSVFLHICRIADNGKFKPHGGAEVIDQLTVEFKQHRLFIVGRFLVVDVLAAYAFAVKLVLDMADTVLIHLLIRDGLLGGAGDLTFLFCPSYGFFHPPAVCGRQLGVGPDDEMFPAHGCPCRWFCSEWKQVFLPPY